MQKKDTVSVIIPTWNRAHTIVDAVKSVLQQTVPVLEILICDDGSTDNTAELLRLLNDGRIKIIGGLRAGRPAIPRNRGIRAAQGEWIAFLDSDDTWIPEKLEHQFQALQKQQTKASCTNAWRVVPAKGPVSAYLSFQSERISLGTLLKTNYVICSSVLVSKSLLEEVGGFPEDERLKAIEDFGLWLRVATKTQFAYCQEPLVNYTDDAANSIRVDAREAVQRENVMRNYFDWYKTQHNRNYAREVKRAYRLAMKNNGRSFLERWKVK